MPTNNSEPNQKNSKTQLILISMGIALVLLLVVNFVFIINPDRSLISIKFAVGEWAPYTGEDLYEKGVATAIVSKIFQDMGFKSEYEFMPWKIAEERAASGQYNVDIQGAFPYLENKKRRTKFYFSDPLLSLNFAVFYHAENNPAGEDIRKIDDLANHTILAIEGYEYPEEIRFFSDTINTMKDNLSAFLELGKRKDPVVVVEAIEVGEKLLEQKLPHLAKYIKTAQLNNEQHLKLMLSRNNPDNLSLILEFNVKLNQFKSNEDEYVSFQNIIKNKIDLARAVTLESYEFDGVIRAFKDSSKNEVIFLPKGSKAIIKEWDESYLRYLNNNKNSVNSLVKIRLLNGPFSLNEQILYIDGRAIRIP